LDPNVRADSSAHGAEHAADAHRKSGSIGRV
jgi:hypothetical protein